MGNTYEVTENGLTKRVWSFSVLDHLVTLDPGGPTRIEPIIEVMGCRYSMSSDTITIFAEELRNLGAVASGALILTLVFKENGAVMVRRMAEGIISTTGLDSGGVLRNICMTSKILVNPPSGTYEVYVNVMELWNDVGYADQFKTVKTVYFKDINWKDLKTRQAEAEAEKRKAEEERRKANAIVVKDGLAAQSYKPASIKAKGLGWRMSDGKVTISADRICNLSRWSAGALKMTLWYCEKPYAQGDDDTNKKYEMADGVISPNALSGESGKDFFDHPQIVGDIKGDPPTGDYYPLIVIYERKAEGGWEWREEASWDTPHHWDNQAEARERELNRRDKTTYTLPSADIRQRVFDAIAEAREAMKAQRPAPKPLGMDVLFDGIPLWSGDATDGLDFPIGVKENGNPLVMEIGDTNVHGLVGGMTGSGKSNLLHAIIHSLCWKYSPAELELHLLDYKDGMEFKVYSNEDESQVWLPHAKTISTHNDPAYALSLFDELQCEAMRRKKIFGSARSYREFRQKGGKLPRVFVLVDEFHKLFEGTEANAVAERIMQILKQGRSYGIHLLMSTQALRGIDADLTAMKGQISARLALRGNEDDGILDVDNDAAAHIECPMCIYNDKIGQTSGNHQFKVPFVDVDVGSERETQFRREIKNAASSDGFPCRGRVFRGTELPHRPSDADLFEDALDTTGFAVRIGVRDDYLAKPAFVALDDSPNGHFLAAAPNGNDALDDAGNLTCNEVWEGLLDSVLASLKATPDMAVVFYNPLGRSAPTCMSEDWTFLGLDASESQLLDTLKELSQSQVRHRVLIVENWAKAVKLHPRGEFGGTSYFDEPPAETARSVFASAFSSASETLPFHVMLFVRNFSYAKQETFGDYGAIIKGFSQRVGVNLSEGDLSELFPSMTMQGTAHKIFVGSTDSDEVSRFLPFRAEQ